MSSGRFLGIDYGTKRIGVAISDEGGTIAFPKLIMPNDVRIFEKLTTILKEDDIAEIIVGESTDLSGKPNKLSAKIDVFIRELTKRFGLPVHTEKEFLTSVEARRSKTGKQASYVGQSHARIKNEKSKKVDASAAALILQRYLDKINKNK